MDKDIKTEKQKRVALYVNPDDYQLLHMYLVGEGNNVSQWFREQIALYLKKKTKST
jgi:hypothetical protein